MATQITLNLPDRLYERAKRFAGMRRRDVAAALTEFLVDTLPDTNVDAAPANLTEQDAAVEREMQAYLGLHPSLRAQYMGKVVAILDGKLIDHDDDFDALYTRIDHAYPNRFVWMSVVEEEPIQTLTFRSPRLVQKS